jgi:hypothetical protein
MNRASERSMVREMGAEESVSVSGNERVSGFAFSVLTKILSLLLTLGLIYLGFTTIDVASLHSWQEIGLVLAGLALLLAGQIYILRSKTTIDREYISQSWSFRKRVRIAHIAECKLVYIPFLSWIITPRLVIRVGIVHFFVFYAADPAVLRAFLSLVYHRTLSPFPPSGPK